MKNDRLTDEQIDPIIEAALAEDIAGGDVTSEAIIAPELFGKASLLFKEPGVLAGNAVAGRVFHLIDPSLDVQYIMEDGEKVEEGDVTVLITGNVASILKAERTALNFIQRMSGIATITARYTAETVDLPAKIYDTRKTTPGLRLLEKYSVRMGGGCNHRSSLSDSILIKDNHIAALRATGMSLKDIISKARKNGPAGITLEVEVTSTKEALEALRAGADVIMLDNMLPTEMRQAVNLIARRAKLEASGNVNLANIHQVAMTGVDMISIGALTHSVKSLDISLELEPQTLNLL